MGGGNLSTVSKPDEFVKEDKKDKKLSTKAKWGIAGGALAFGGLVVAAIFTKGKTLKPANFAEHIDFKPAQTMEEAVEFAKKHLGIQNFNLGNDLEMANWVNEGLVQINNMFKGKVQMPKNVIFDEKYFAKNPNGTAYHCAKNETIAINKAYFDGVFEKLNKLIERGKVSAEKVANEEPISYLDYAYSLLNKKITRINERKFICKEFVRGLDVNLQGSILAKIDKYKTTPNAFSRFEVNNLLQQIQDLSASAKKMFEEPMVCIKNIADRYPEAFKKHCKELNYYEKLPKNKQVSACIRIIDELSHETQEVISVAGSNRGVSKFGTIWHEMGHLLHDMNTSLKDKLWGRLSGKAKEAFLADAEKLKTAGKISWYAQTNPCEFVAETFKALCAGRKLPDDVMKLYEYYKGPMLPNM